MEKKKEPERPLSVETKLNPDALRIRENGKQWFHLPRHSKRGDIPTEKERFYKHIILFLSNNQIVQQRK
jgi:hypothetical protein